LVNLGVGALMAVGGIFHAILPTEQRLYVSCAEQLLDYTKH
jgi:hypothetical protein